MRIAPGARALAVSQDRVTEKTFLNAHGAGDGAPSSRSNEPDDIVAGLRPPGRAGRC